eukprot:604336-Alexandrium_andersonii.AAC.1
MYWRVSAQDGWGGAGWFDGTGIPRDSLWVRPGTAAERGVRGGSASGPAWFRRRGPLRSGWAVLEPLHPHGRLRAVALAV